ncbi:winged helix-turn-helix transcriptional regulator [Alsobacter sp. R-9]
MLGVLEAVETGRLRSQRHLAAELGIALGLANAYVKRCVRKGLMKVSEIPARRYSYYLTPQGFAEKSRLAAEYLSYSFSFFRQARTDCAELFGTARARGWSRVVLVGRSEVAEVAALCAIDAEVTIVAVVDPAADTPRFLGVPVVDTVGGLSDRADGAVVCSIRETAARIADTEAEFGRNRVLVPNLLSPRRSEAGHG